MHSKLKQPGGKYDSLAALLQGAGFRPTRQRLALAAWLFDGPDKHVTPEQAYAAMLKARIPCALATVYNTLNDFRDAGLLGQVVIDSGRSYFDTHTGGHYHIFDETSGQLTDIPVTTIPIAQLPKIPAGKKLSRIDIIVRVKSGP